MATVSLLNVSVRNNPAKFDDKYEFEITFECLEPLVKDLEWKLTYVGSATSSDHDQELDTLLVGPIPVGVNKFLFEADPPNTARIPATDIIGVTVILLSCSYDDREFVRVGYYVNNEYEDPMLAEDPPVKPVIEKVRRNILAEKPRVTRFAIKWDSEESAPAEFPPEQPDVDEEVEDGVQYGAEEEEEEVEGEGEGEEVKGEDVEMEGVEGKVKAEEDEESEAGSEDLGEDSEEDEDEELEEEDGDGEGEANGDDMETDEKDTSGTDHDSDESGGDGHLTAEALASHNAASAEHKAQQEARDRALAIHNVLGTGVEPGPVHSKDAETPSDRGSESHCDSTLLDCETDVPDHIAAMLDDHWRLPGVDYTFK